jgi:hypothetical protein
MTLRETIDSVADQTLPAGMAGVVSNVLASAANVGAHHAMALADSFGSAPGSLGIGDATWMGSQDFCAKGHNVDVHQGAGGEASTQPKDNMYPGSVNCHEDAGGGPRKDPRKQCGGCAGNQFQSTPANSVAGLGLA